MVTQYYTPKTLKEGLFSSKALATVKLQLQCPYVCSVSEASSVVHQQWNLKGVIPEKWDLWLILRNGCEHVVELLNNNKANMVVDLLLLMKKPFISV